MSQPFDQKIVLIHPGRAAPYAIGVVGRIIQGDTRDRVARPELHRIGQVENEQQVYPLSVLTMGLDRITEQMTVGGESYIPADLPG